MYKQRHALIGGGGVIQVNTCVMAVEPGVTVPEWAGAAALSLTACSASASAPRMVSSSSSRPTSSPLPAPMMFAAATTCHACTSHSIIALTG